MEPTPDNFEVEPETLVPVTTLGRGSYGKVTLASISKDGKETLVAVKVVAKSRLKSKVHVEKAVCELKVMTEAKSRFLLRCLGSFQTDDALYYVMPYSSGGELFFHLQRIGKFRESRARLLIQHIVLGLEHLHDHGILYRDLKPENILITESGRAQVADFGLAKFLPKFGTAAERKRSMASVDSQARNGLGGFFSSLLRRKKDDPQTIDADTKIEVVWGTTKTRCGTPAYQSPEIVLSPEGQVHSLESDWWALGVLSYEIMVGDPPFMAQSIKEVYELILQNKITFPKKLSEQAQQFILDLTTTDRKLRLGYGRPDAFAVKAHPFFKIEKGASWESVENWTCPSPLDLSDVNLGSSPKDAVFFHAEFTSEDVREYIPPPKVNFPTSDFKGFVKVPNDAFEKFVSKTPVSVITKADVAANGIYEDDLKKETKQ
jgi:serine/threonine protein kinase